MGTRLTELEFDELERLLCEIPSATSGHLTSEESGLTNSANNFKEVCLDDSLSSKGSLTEKFQNNGSSDEGKLLSVHRTQQPSTKRVFADESYLPDDQSLTSAFAELNFNGGVTMEATSPTFPNHTFSHNGQYPYSLNKFPSPRSPNNSVSGFDGFAVKRNTQENPNLLNVNVQEVNKQQVGYCQPIGNLSSAMPPLPHGMQGFQFLSNVPVHGVEFPIISDQQGYFVDAQPYVASRHMEEEQFYKMPKQYMYLQQFRNERLEAHHPVQANRNLPNRIFPHSHHLEQSNQGPFWKRDTISKCINESSRILSTNNSNTMHVLDKVGKQGGFPQKVITRSHGLDSMRSVKFGSFGGTELLANVNQNERLFSNNNNFHHGLYVPNASSRCSSPETDDLKSNYVRTPNQKYISINELAGGIYLMAKDQYGCRFLQRKFTEGTKEDVEKIFAEIIDHIVELMTDPFGNYLVQKLLEVCDEDQRMQILHAITGNPGDLVRISCDMHGTRAVQKVIETLRTPEQFSMVVSTLKPGIVTLIKNMNGNHVAQRCLQYLTAEYSEFLFEAATANCIELATDRHGCCVLQKCLSHSGGEERNRLISEITSNALILSQDPYGNYVVQFVFEIRVPWAIANILDQLEGNYGDLSMQKYSSNVVEKCLKYAGEECRFCIIQELMNNPRLDQIMQDPYGNYVIQAALNYSKGVLHGALVEAITPLVPVLRTSPYGKKVLSSNCLKK